MKKAKEINKPANILFNTQTFEGIYITILSFIEDNKSCFNFSQCNKSLWKCFENMLEKSSTRYYRLKKLNNKPLTEFTFDLYGDRLPVDFDMGKVKNYYNTTQKEFEGKIDNKELIEVLSGINQKFPESCLISGSYAVKCFIKGKDWEEHSKLMMKASHYKEKKGKKSKWSYASRDFKKEAQESEQDIDIFILGKQKKKVFHALIDALAEKFPNYSIVNRKGGLYDVYDVEEDFNRNKWVGRKDRGYLGTGVWKAPPRSTEYLPHPVFQIIVKDIHTTPSDVFAFFDLDVCKIGYFPFHKTVPTCSSFLRAIAGRINYIDLYQERAGWKHFYRIIKYFHRTRIRTTCEVEPLLSFFHTHNINFMPKRIYLWAGDSFDQMGKKNENDLKVENDILDKYSYYQDLYYTARLNIEKKRMSLKKAKGIIEFETESCTDQKIPYVCSSVGIIHKDGKYCYDARPKYFLDYVKEVIAFEGNGIVPPNKKKYDKNPKNMEDRRKEMYKKMYGGNY